MTWTAEYHKFWNTFMQAFPENNVPEDVTFPWLTYQISRGTFGEETNVSIHLHYHTESEAEPNAMAERIVKTIDGNGNGYELVCDEGVLLLHVANPAWYPVTDSFDRTHKHRMINIAITWLLTR